MDLTPALPRRFPKFQALATRLLLALAAACGAVAVGAGIVLLSFRLAYADRALPGVWAAGLDLSGLSQPEIELALGTRLTYPNTGLVIMHDDETIWTATPAELGIVLDIPGMARQALAVGREGSVAEKIKGQMDAWYAGHSVPPMVIFDQRMGSAYLEGLAAQIDRPILEASVGVNGLTIEMVPGQIGRRLDIAATLEALSPTLTRLHDTNLDLVVEETAPLVLDASEAAETARGILSAPLSLTAEGAGPWVVEPAELATMMHFDLVTNQFGTFYAVDFDLQPIEELLEPLAPDLAREPENARFIFNDDTRELDLLQSAVIGRNLDLPATLEAIRQGLQDGEHEIPLVFEIHPPEVGDEATAADLGITEAVSVVSTYFSGSSASRIQNIKTAAAAFHGLLVAPGETLSMAEVLGEISLDTGYSEAWIIYGGRTIKGVGGGVCQVSTTLFRAVFFGGYEIVERHPHAYRVSYYESGPNSPGPGMDATVFIPLVDFKFTNDTPHWLLLETYVYRNRQLQWKFYSTSDGRTVDWYSSGPKNVREAPDPLYRENEDLPTGTIKQVDWEANGMDILVTRTVTRNGEELHHDIIRTRYRPWQAIYEYGPGTELPEEALPPDEDPPEDEVAE
jgi:vancomycin resistance protein YoaR